MSEPVSQDEIRKALETLPPWPWKKKQTLDYIQWSTQLLFEIADRGAADAPASQIFDFLPHRKGKGREGLTGNSSGMQADV